MKPKFHYGEKIRYKLDTMFSKGAWMIIFWLGMFSLSIIILFSLVIVIFKVAAEGESVLPLTEAIWQSLMRTLDAGNMAGDAGWGFRLIMLLVTLSGVFFISTLIGLITSGLEQRLDNLQRGRSRVIETGHVVILGWSEQVYTIIEELVIANENQPEGCIVIMGPGDKVEMENLIHEHISDTGNTKIVVRSGDPLDMSSLNILNLDTSKAIIVLSPKGDDTDSEVIKTCLAVTKRPRRNGKSYHIVAELHDLKNKQVAELIGGDQIEWLLTGDIIAKVIALTCRQPGLSIIYTDLLDFAGDEIYFYQDPQLVGKKFGDTLPLFEKNAVMGLWKKGRIPELNPEMDSILEEGDQLFLLAEDDDQIFPDYSIKPLVEEEKIVTVEPQPAVPEKILILGWNWRGPLIVQELDEYVAPQSIVKIVCNLDLGDCLKGFELEGCKNLSVSHQVGDTVDRALLDRLALEDFDEIIVLCYSECLPAQVADAHTLITLLHLRDIAVKNPKIKYSITTEMLDVRNRNLAEIAKADDFIVSDKLISLMFSQIAEQKALNAVFTDIFDPEGSEIYLKPMGQYVALDTPVNFYTLIESAKRKNEIALGYRITQEHDNPEKNYGIVLNPKKSEAICFTGEDKLIVVAES
ncbi:MAG: hypothetical protein WCY93_10905 [Anaerolineaceae bacterium]